MIAVMMARGLLCAGLTRVCHLQGVPLIVDEAHGAHLGLHPALPASAMQQGADLAIQSTHKVLTGMTQAAMLHVQGNRIDPVRVSRSLQMLQVRCLDVPICVEISVAYILTSTWAFYHACD